MVYAELLRSYRYDREGRLISATKTGTTVTYNYDGVGRRIEKNVNGTVTKYVYSGQNLIEERDSSNTVTAKYVYAGGIDNPVKVIKGSEVYYFQQDALGNVTALVDASGDIFESYTYNVFGAPAIKDANGDPLTEASTPFLFTGREYDGETGLYHYRNHYRTRAYSPELGRFLQPDSINFEGGDVNLYRYVANNPVNLTDSLGLSSDNCCKFSDCFKRCIDANGGGWALGALGLGGPFASIPSPIPKAQFGSKNPYTSIFSIGARSLGQQGLAQLARRLNPAANVIAAAAGGYLAGLSISCSAMCASDCNSW